MYLFPDLGVIFIRAPKTGSTSFLWSMRQAEHHPQFVGQFEHEEHNTARQARGFFDRETWGSHEKIGFIRHPYDWVTSIYHTNIAAAHLGETTDGKTLLEFVEGLKPTSTLLRWFDGEDVTIYRLEDLPNIMEGYGGQSLHVNRTPFLQYKPHNLIDEEKQAIERKFVREMKYYG